MRTGKGGLNSGACRYPMYPERNITDTTARINRWAYSTLYFTIYSNSTDPIFAEPAPRYTELAEPTIRAGLAPDTVWCVGLVSPQRTRRQTISASYTVPV